MVADRVDIERSPQGQGVVDELGDGAGETVARAEGRDQRSAARGRGAA
jgi:hypothetical protein